MTLNKTLAGLGLALALKSSVSAQTKDGLDNITDCRKEPTAMLKVDCTVAHMQIKTIYLTNVSNINDGNEIVTAVRNAFDPSLKIYLVPGKNAIVVGTYPEEIARIEALIHDLDTPRKTFRLTYTIKETENGKSTGTSQHFTLFLVDGQRTTLKRGLKVPILTGSFSAGGSDSKTGTPGTETQFTYLDVGINIDATLTAVANGGILHSKIEESAVADPKPGAPFPDPTISQSVLEGNPVLILGKPTVLGSLDIPGTTRHAEIEALLEPAQ